MSASIDASTQRWAALIVGLAARFGFNGVEHDELTQQVRIRLWRALQAAPREKADGIVNGAYAYQAAYSAAIDIARARRARRSGVHVSIDDASIEVAAPSPGVTLTDAERRVGEALKALDPDRRVAARLHLKGHALSDIVALTGWSEARTRNLVYRALHDLRAALADND